MISKGVKARYMMPAFSPFAGFSPNCWAVRVQIEHWASAVVTMNKKASIKIQTTMYLFLEQCMQQNYRVAEDNQVCLV